MSEVGGKLREFVRESNLIEGIARDPEFYEIEAHQRLIACNPFGPIGEERANG